MPEKKLTKDELLSLYFEAQFCEPNKKAEKEQAWLTGLGKAAEQTGKPLYALKHALLMVYPQYRARRLGKELPDLPLPIRSQ